MRSIRQQLLLGLISGMVTAILAVGIGSFLKVRHETNELFDYQLKQIVRSFPLDMSPQNSETDDRHPGKKIVVQVWNPAHAMVFSSNPARNLPRYPQTGFFEVSFGARAWRIYSEENHQQLVQVGQLIADRESIQYSLALRSLIPLLILIALLAGLIWLVVGRSLRGLTQLAEALGERSVHVLHPLENALYAPELMPIVDATNALLTRLDESIQLQKMFVADAAHELRTPLTALKLQLQLVERCEEEAERRLGFVKLHERLNRAIHLVKQLLTLARQSNHEAQTWNSQLNLPHLLRQLVGEFSLLAENKDIDLGVEVSEETLCVGGNEDALLTLFGNLLDNAIRYTPAHGRIDVAVGRRGAQPCVSIADNGSGIPQTDRARIFDRFYRVERNAESGSGLGLAIVRKIADQHHAQVILAEPESGPGLLVSVVFAA
ncbi:MULTISPECIES: HAMP domain-containing sensor histidine kinase [unclassified Undibacterium]|uniref:sensor histidine kinase n=2 Tax=Bacteria TaxID=2 RepID=UPI002AC91B5B|nr:MULTISPECIES: HAMP domain-containing sensor histidine kinase [unclassified Undibacterium]MEB0139281.1 HAMP domain-containing sensor histidine kinase [Undibacterium sp. CCC2.1]MEB0172125.1 HAMP domain-containing sensor histidine kinase [Undibacterium sp. CCC1.1]MEB0176000.1 HAMP domain-containing sensor histidine kinase [Undibacterium sp. CCC3.4]MEB0215312.1 HAMP domain-containing sensor histidine kinase [Undibacterium sp. 5I2]WPX45485.1 HAMP domain-containing sensor histidine kinase [Undiba